MSVRGGAHEDVSVIIPNRGSTLIDKTLESIFSQTVFRRVGEILVVGTDEPGLVSEADPVRFVSTGTPVTAPVARNIGIVESTGAIIVFIDADCIAEPTWLEALLAAYTRAKTVVGGSVSLEANTYWQRCYNLTMFHEFLSTAPAGTRQNLGTINLCVAREVVEDVGLFDERLPRGQDTEWTLRMRRQGYELRFAPDAVVKHFPDVGGLSSIVRLWHLSGFFNSQVRRRYRDIADTPPCHDRPLPLVLLSPVIGAGVTGRIFARDPRLLRHLDTIPVVFLTKVAWCLGAARGLH